MEQGADAEDRCGQDAEEEQVLGAAGADEGPEDQAPDGAAGQSVANDLVVFLLRVGGRRLAVAFAEAEEDENGGTPLPPPLPPAAQQEEGEIESPWSGKDFAWG